MTRGSILDDICLKSENRKANLLIQGIKIDPNVKAQNTKKGNF